MPAIAVCLSHQCRICHRHRGMGIYTSSRFGVHIRCCGNGHLGFRPDGGSLGKAPSNQGLLPLSFGASPRLGMPSLRSCSVGPPRSAIHGRARLTRHPCRVAHCAEPALSLTRGRCVKINSCRRANARPDCRSCRAKRGCDLLMLASASAVALALALDLPAPFPEAERRYCAGGTAAGMPR